MEIYVYSAGVSQQDDYCWRRITENNQEEISEPALVSKFKELLETESPSLLLARDYNQLILLVTGIKASQRKDYRGRTIRNSVAWIFPYSEENEQKLQELAALSLRGELDNKIDDAITQDDEYGFKVSFQEIVDIISSLNKRDRINTAESNYMLAYNSPVNRDKLATLLETKSLPHQEKNVDVLIVVTGIKAEDTLIKNLVWRGLSNLIKYQSFTEYNPQVTNIVKKNSGGSRTQANNSQMLILIFAGLGLMAIFLWFFFRFFSPIQGLKVEYPPAGAIAAMSLGGQHIVSNTNGNLLVQSLTDTNTSSSPRAVKPTIEISSLAVNSDGTVIIGGANDGQIWLWQYDNAQKQFQGKPFLKKHIGKVLSVAISQDGNTIASSGADGTVFMWNRKGEIIDEKKLK
ncbi:WD40 repeat domain-containing protein [Aliinostoc sp. HNIBRCY26]|uniref:WD40 repeat domain-containing protein n=1 Tax=Aliinostoc sp. HNIBRCY26 TaxID=3418997 RepID=UPI003D06CCC4